MAVAAARSCGERSSSAPDVAPRPVVRGKAAEGPQVALVTGQAGNGRAERGPRRGWREGGKVRADREGQARGRGGDARRRRADRKGAGILAYAQNATLRAEFEALKPKKKS